MTDFEGRTFSENNVEYTIHEHIAVLDTFDGRETPWRKEVNIVSWNGGEPKVDIRDWNESHERMSRGLSLSEKQAEKLAMALGLRMMCKQKEHREKDSFER